MGINEGIDPICTMWHPLMKVTITKYKITMTKNVMGICTQIINHQIIAKITRKIINAQFTEVLEEYRGFLPPMPYLSSLDPWG